MQISPTWKYNLDGSLIEYRLSAAAGSLPLDGVVNIVYRSEDGRVCGTGRIHNAEGGTVLESGSNAIYAEILTDIDVQGMDFTLEIETPFTPVEPETAAGGNGA